MDDKREEAMLQAILENQIILAEGVWMILQSQGHSATLGGISTRISATRKLLEDAKTLTKG